MARGFDGELHMLTIKYFFDTGKGESKDEKKSSFENKIKMHFFLLNLYFAAWLHTSQYPEVDFT